MARKNGRMMMIAIGSPKAAWGSATPSGLLSRPDLPQDDEQRQDRHRDGEQQAESEQAVEELAALERVPRDHERGHRRRGQHHEPRSARR